MKIKFTDHYYTPYAYPDTIHIRTNLLSITFTFYALANWCWNDWLIEIVGSGIILELPSMSLRIIKWSV